MLSLPRTPLSLLGLFLMASFASAPAHAGSAPTWNPITWHGEAALASDSQGWKAIVSLPRGRLVHFGPADGELNLLFETANASDPAGWAGHRLWLGQQKSWPKIWPPPAAWEHSAAANVSEAGGQLRLELSPVEDGWPDLVRTYHWDGARLVCGAELRGGQRPAQVISIFQVPRRALISADAKPEAGYPAGFVRLPSAVSGFAAQFDALAHVSDEGDTVTLRHLNKTEKLGFRPETLTARLDGYTLHVMRGAETGERAGEPDEGFHSQVYLGRADEPFIELEQLTSLWSPSQPARAEVILAADRP